MDRSANSERALVFAPHGRDAEVARALLREAGFTAEISSNIAVLCREMELGAALAIITQEALGTTDSRELEAWVKLQPLWSDFPFILLTERGDDPSRASLAQLFQALLGNVTFLERPFHPTTLANVARSALRARRRQYEARSVLDRQALLTREVLHRTKILSRSSNRSPPAAFGTTPLTEQRPFKRACTRLRTPRTFWWTLTGEALRCAIWCNRRWVGLVAECHCRDHPSSSSLASPKD